MVHCVTRALVQGLWDLASAAGALQSCGPCGGNAERVRAQTRALRSIESGSLRSSPPSGWSVQHLLQTFIPPGNLAVGPGVSADPQARSQITCPGWNSPTAHRDGTESLSGIWSWLGGCGDLQLGPIIPLPLCFPVLVYL